jgi:UDP-N-acetylmuramoylalanine--D-glutamate ligase
VTDATATRPPLPLAGRRVLVFGLAKSGQAAAELLVRRGARVVGVDEGEAARPLLDGDWGRAHLERGAATPELSLLDGVELFVLSPGIPAVHPFVRAAQARRLPVVSEIELAYRCSTARVAAVTGSKGKSTTTALAGALLAAQGRRCRVAGNIGLPYSAVAEDLGPDDWVVLELSSFQLETVDAFHADIAVMLGVSPDHLDRYASLHEYAAAKMRIARHQTAADVLVVDPDDATGAAMAAVSPARVLGFGTAWRGAGVVQQGGDLVWCAGGAAAEVLARVEEVPLLGAHNLRNAMAALAVARVLGPVDGAVRRALAGFAPLPYRMQPAGEIAGIRFVNDSKGTTVDAVRAGVRGLPGPLLLGLGGRNKDLDFASLRPDLGAVRAALVFGEAAPEIEAALAGAVVLERVRDLDEMVARALQLGRPGDTFLFSPGCTSFDLFRNAEHRGQEFDAAVRRARTRTEEARR